MNQLNALSNRVEYEGDSYNVALGLLSNSYAIGVTSSPVNGRGTSAHPSIAGRIAMLDLIMLLIGLGFFALSVGYTIACDRL